MEFEGAPSRAWCWGSSWSRGMSPLLIPIPGTWCLGVPRSLTLVMPGNLCPLAPRHHKSSPLSELLISPPTPPPALERSARQLGVCQSACFPVTSKNISTPTPLAAATFLPLFSEDLCSACPHRQGKSPEVTPSPKIPHWHQGTDH